MYRKETRSENEALRHSTVRWNSPKKEVEKGKGRENQECGTLKASSGSEF